MYIYIYNHADVLSAPAASPIPVGLYKILFSCETVVHESTIRSFPAPTCIAHPGAILVHDYWAVNDSPSELSSGMLCTIPSW